MELVILTLVGWLIGNNLAQNDKIQELEQKQKSKKIERSVTQEKK